MSEETKEERKLDITTTKVVAGALAAVTAAFLGAQLGVAGTVIGAALASVVSTIGGALYEHSLDRSRNAVRDKIGTVRTERLDAPTEVIARPQPERGKPWWTRRRWWVVGATSGLAFALAMVLVTGIELIGGQPLSGNGGGSTVGKIFQGGSGQHREQPPVEQPPPTTSERPAPTTTNPPTTQNPPTTTAPPTTTTPPPATTTQSPPTTTSRQETTG
ncbi:hypothetical protein [Allokutzneria albata]|uniref:Uncharacterized protein n=1 Tax=Allokutzneria albata TaxID=211114 RepID=A0A1H0AUG5_ALLAB|nr:hypothetical protein [Allokutzneria albata]SDN36756.1 hypothetical protein SAMN04489726_6269 [Allokutzneria albata]